VPEVRPEEQLVPVHSGRAGQRRPAHEHRRTHSEYCQVL